MNFEEFLEMAHSKNLSLEPAEMSQPLRVVAAITEIWPETGPQHTHRVTDNHLQFQLHGSAALSWTPCLSKK